jgi:hypothetical protein
VRSVQVSPVIQTEYPTQNFAPNSDDRNEKIHGESRSFREAQDAADAVFWAEASSLIIIIATSLR